MLSNLKNAHMEFMDIGESLLAVSMIRASKMVVTS
jgi:hypothetical protein